MNISNLNFSGASLNHIHDPQVNLASDNLVINLAKSDYIPYGFLGYNLYDINYEERTLNFDKNVKLWAQKATNSSSVVIRDTMHSYNINSTVFYHVRPTDAETYISPSLIIKGGKVVFSIAFDSDYLKFKLADAFEESTVGSFYQLCKNHHLFNQDSIKNIFHYDIRNKMKTIDRDELVENSVIFMDTEFIDKYDNHDRIKTGLCSDHGDFRDIRKVKDNTRDYFTSKILNKLQIPSFSDIDAPETISLGIIREYYEENAITI